MERVVSLGVSDVRVGVVSDEQLNDIKVSVPRCPLHRRCDKVPSQRVDFSALFEEIAACGDLSVNGSPMQRGNVLFVAVGCLCFARFYKFTYGSDISALRGDEYVDLVSMSKQHMMTSVRTLASGSCVAGGG